LTPRDLGHREVRLVVDHQQRGELRDAQAELREVVLDHRAHRQPGVADQLARHVDAAVHEPGLVHAADTSFLHTMDVSSP
jgi:hypothetical protein